MIVFGAVFWLCLAGMVHTYLTYPAALRLLPRRYRRPPCADPSTWPTVALLIPAYNEEKVIAAKVENALALDYEAGRLEILVGSDGSTDRTNDIVRACRDARLRLIELPGRNGKPGVINRLAAETRAEILVISDANVLLDLEALRRLVRHFADPQVGLVSGGKYILIPEEAKGVGGEATYGRLENKLRELESDVGGMSGAVGSLMALRHCLFAPYRPGVICDDMDISVRAVLQGFRQVHDSSAKAFEEAGYGVGQEFRRRVRIGAGNFQVLMRYPQMLNPRRGVVAFTYFSHKVLRWVFPFLMLGMLLASLFLAKAPFYRGWLYAQIAGYGASAVGFLLDRAGVRVPLLSSLYHFTALNLALFLGFFVYCRGVTSSAWERTAREAGR